MLICWCQKNRDIYIPEGNPLGSALAIFLSLRLYFTVYPSSHHNTDTVKCTVCTLQWPALTPTNTENPQQSLLYLLAAASFLPENVSR